MAFKDAIDGKVIIEVYNQLGQIVYTDVKSNIMPYSVISLNTARYSDGIYFVNVKTKEGVSSKKLIVTH